ncbi:hypothetical protein TNCV_1927101 [Trichonephila clavipes]|nr:hypothetical protein TNCV_1927101 [Trichonephila clavipes]
MENFSKCPLYPKPRRGSNTTPNNYSTAVNSLIRPNISFEQATSIRSANNTKNPQQMAAQAPTRRNPAISNQNQANQIVTPTPSINNVTVEDNSPQDLTLKTLQQTIQALTVLTQQVSALSFNSPAPNLKELKVNSTKRFAGPFRGCS